jgi:hypothetical protein
MAPTSQRDWPFRREIVSRKPVSIHCFVVPFAWTSLHFELIALEIWVNFQESKSVN